MKVSIKDIVKNDLCTGCGVCVSKSTSSSMVFDTYGFLVPDDNLSLSTNAIHLCPFNPSPEEEVKDEDKIADIFLESTTHKDLEIGKYNSLYVGYASQYRLTSSSGGLATYVFEQLLLDHIVDYLFVVTEVNNQYQYQLFDSAHDIRKVSKTRYTPVTLSELFSILDKIEGKVAVSGVACFIKAIRLKQYYNPELKERIPFLVGIICGGLKSKHYSDFLAQKAGIEEKYYHQDYRIKDPASNATDYSFGAFNSQNEYFQVKMNSLGDMWGSGLFKSNACDFCDDVTTELADISLGDAWLQPYVMEGLGNSVIVTRSLTADKIIQNGIKSGKLFVEKLSLEKFKESQQGSFNHRHKGLKYRIQINERQGKIIPYKRNRFFEEIPFYLKIVQKQRMKVRALSHLIWNKNQNANQFENEMEVSRERLSRLTLFSHRLKKIQGIILKR